jgi:hypothetical protein
VSTSFISSGGAGLLFTALGLGKADVPTVSVPTYGILSVANFAPAKTGTNAANKVTCSTALPNGQTVGAVVRKQRAILQSYFQGANDAAANGVPRIPLVTIYGSFAAIAQGNGPIDFKNTFPAADRNTMGLAGNFAYYAIGAGYFPTNVLDLGAASYAIKAAFTPGTSVHFSDLTGHFFSDTAAATEKRPGLASNGCGA